MLTGYGLVAEGSLNIGDHRIELESIENGRVYRRIYRGEVKAELLISGVEKIVLTPIYPVMVPKFFTQYILLELKEPLVIAPGSHIVIYTFVPVDLAVYVYRSEMYRIVDAFSINKIKYTLYGPIEQGVVARYWRTELLRQESYPGLGKALTRLVVVNKTREWARLSKILLDSSPLKLYYRRGSWEAYTQELSLTIDTPSTASIVYGKPFVEDAVAIDDPPELKPPRITNRTDMLWGI